MEAEKIDGRRLRGMQLVIRMMGLLKVEDATAVQMARTLCVDDDLALKWAHSMQIAGLAHVVEWLPNDNNKGRRRALYRFGHGANAVRPCGRPLARQPAMANLAALRVMWDALAEPCTRGELVEVTGFAPGSVNRHLILMRAVGLARVCGHLPRPDGVGGVWMEQLAQGSAPDVKAPKPQPSRVHSKAYYWRKKAANSAGAQLDRVWPVQLLRCAA